MGMSRGPTTQAERDGEITTWVGHGLEVGDLIVFPPLWRPRWWQFWKRWPFVARVPKAYRVTGVTATTLTID